MVDETNANIKAFAQQYNASVQKSVEEQLKKVAEDYEEYFEPTTNEPGKTPQFGAGVSGTMPKGQEKTTVDGIWFGAKK